MRATSILWRRIDGSGHDAAQIIERDDICRLIGSAVFVESQQPVRLEYSVTCDSEWRTRSAGVRGSIGIVAVDIEVAVSGGRWSMNGAGLPELDGCVDIDLNFSPSTNLLPIRRLRLSVGQSEVVRAAWLQFPSLQFAVLEQVYRRLDANIYEYESDGGAFRATLEVNEVGFPTSYAGLWEAVASG